MGRTGTGIALGTCLAALAFLIVLDRRPYRPGKPNHVPLMIVLAALAILLGEQLLQLSR